MSKSNQRLGNLTEQDINFPKHLTPEVVGPLFIKGV